MIKNILKYICLINILACCFCICVHAEGATYLTPVDTITNLGTWRGDPIQVKSSASDVRIVFIYESSNNYTGGVFFVKPQNSNSTASFKVYGYGWTNIPFNRPYTVDGVNYVMGSFASMGGMNSSWNPSDGYGYPKMNNNSDTTALYYTYGEGAIEPVEPINWGLLRDVTYQTRIAGNGSAAIRNVDYLTWETLVDSNGNDISECEVEIQCVPGDFFGSSESDLLNKTYQNFNIANYSAFSLGTMSASSGTFSVSWSYILNHLGWNLDSVYSHLENELWIKNGWYYQIRLIGSDGTEGQWQTMYTPLSQSSKASETVINQNSFDMSIYQVYQELSTINNNTSITINIEDTDYTVTNPDDGDEPQEGTDLWDILKQMLNGIFQIVKNIAALPGKLFDMIQSLFIMPDSYNFGDQLDTEINSYMEENQPGLLAIQEGTADIRDTLEDTAPAGSGQYPQCIFTWDAVQLDLSPFNAGTVTFFAAGSFDFTAAFIQMIEGFGMSYSDYQFYVSAVIYLWLVVFIYRHVNTFLKGGGETKSG